MPLSSYGTTNPRGLEPFNIESVLAPLAVGSNQAEAQNMLDYYQIANKTASNLYGQDMAQQHQYAYDQLAQQMAEARLKAVPELLKSGGAAYLGPGGLPGMNMAGDPNVTQNVIDAANAEQQGKTFQSVMTGLNQGSQGGYQVAGGVVPGLSPNIQLTNKGPERVQVAQISEAGRNARAGAAAAVAGIPRVTTNYRDPTFGTENSVSFGPKMTQQQRNDFLRNNAGLVPVDRPPPNPALPGVGPASSAGSPAAPATGGAAAAPSAGSGRPQNTQAGAAAMQQKVLAMQDRLPSIIGKDGAADVAAAMARNKGAPVVQPDASKPTGWALVGASGKHY